jgi:flavorubredoxin
MKVLIVYDSKTGNTEKMAKAIAEGAAQVRGVSAEAKKIGEKFPLSLLAEAYGVAFGSPTRYADVTNEMKDFLEHVESYVKLKKMKLAGKRAGVFGSYGYDGAWVMEERLRGYVRDLGYEVYDEACVKVDMEFKEDQAKVLADCKAWGKRFTESLK